jgi:hypothetical protein
MNRVVVEYDHFVGAVAKITLLPRWMAYLKTEPWVDARQRARLEKPVLPFLSNYSATVILHFQSTNTSMICNGSSRCLSTRQLAHSKRHAKQSWQRYTAWRRFRHPADIHPFIHHGPRPSLQISPSRMALRTRMKGSIGRSFPGVSQYFVSFGCVTYRVLIPRRFFLFLLDANTRHAFRNLAGLHKYIVLGIIAHSLVKCVIRPLCFL